MSLTDPAITPLRRLACAAVAVVVLSFAPAPVSAAGNSRVKIEIASLNREAVRHLPALTRPFDLTEQDAVDFSENLLLLINTQRARLGLHPLQYAPRLQALAGDHSAEMARREAISHDGFAGRFGLAGSRLCVENVGARFRDPETQLEGWRTSPDHYRNLLDPGVRKVGIANIRGFVTYFACA